MEDARLAQLVREYEAAGEADAQRRVAARVAERLAQIEEEDDLFMETLLEKHPTMSVNWLRPWYQRLDKGVTRTLKDIDPYNPEQYRTDSFTKEEDDILEKNWKRFSKIYKVPNKPQCFARWRNKTKNKKVTSPLEKLRCYISAYLARGLQRTVPQVYKHFAIKYGRPVRGPYSEAEEKIMEIGFTFYDEKAVMMLSKVLSRDSRGIYNRYKIYESGKPENKRIEKWTLKLAENFIKSLMTHAECSVEDLQGKKIGRDTWLKVEEDMGIPHDSLKKMWYRKLHVQLFSQTEIRTRSIRRRLCKILSESHYKRWRDIRWNEVTEKFPPGCTPAFLHKIASRYLRTHCKDYINLPLEDVLQIWKACSEKHRMFNKRLRLLHFNSKGKLEFQDEND